ncbi:hypothetical protein ACFWP7_02190 [Streptomyces sp. NPDC058470]|uniref:hypothetical protein n=1 Tax=Streptomyces sp. NPDC058470 TaxID=3346515 RepID=UPI00365A8643
MTKGDFGGLVVAVWTLSILLLVTTATSQSNSNRTLLERLWWKWAINRAEERRADLERKIDTSDHATLPDPPTLNYLQRDDVLFQASQRTFRAKLRVPAATSVPAGVVLAVAVASGKSHEWQEAFIVGVLLWPIVLTMVVMQLVANQGMQRWTTDIVTARARGAYEALLKPLAVPGCEPPGELSFRAPQVSAVQALEGFAIALEQYALQRALPDGRTPMPQVVAHYSSAAAFVRELRDGVELDRPDEGKRALLEMERILKILADGRMRDFAPDHVASEVLLERRQQRQARRRQVLRLVAFTVCAAGIGAVFTLASSALGIAIVTAVAAVVAASWDRSLQTATSRDSTRPTGG